MPVLGQFPTEIHLVDTDIVKWTAGADYPDPNFPNFAVRDVTADVPIGGVDARSTTTETIGASDYTKLVTLSNSGAIAVTLSSTVPNDFFCAVMNIGAGTATLTPSSGQIRFDGALFASIQLVTGQTAVLYFDGTNWEAYVITNGTLQVAQGGTGDTTLTAHAVLLGEGTSPIAFATIGTSGRVLTDNGPGVDPSFQTPAAAATPVENEVVTFTGTAGTLANTPSSVTGYTQVKLYRDGQRLNPGAGNDFTWSGTAVTLATVSAGSVFIADYYK